MSELNKVSVVWQKGMIFVVYTDNGKNYIIGGGNASVKSQNGINVGKALERTLKQFGVEQ